MTPNIIAGSLIVLAILLASAGPPWAKAQAGRVRFPDAVEKTFKAAFPKSEITKVEMEKENGVVKYAVEFTNGGMHKEVDIAADGTLLEEMSVVEAKDVPAAAMGSIQKAATGGAVQRIECDVTSCEPKDGKVIKLPKPMTQYTAVIAKGEKTAEVVVGPDGAIIEPPWWDIPKGSAGNIDRSREAGASQAGATGASSSNKTIEVTK